jgi:hypothetical protein
MLAAHFYANHKWSIIVHCQKWIGLLLALNLEQLALHWLFCKISQSSSHLETGADT